MKRSALLPLVLLTLASLLTVKAVHVWGPGPSAGAGAGSSAEGHPRRAAGKTSRGAPGTETSPQQGLTGHRQSLDADRDAPLDIPFVPLVRGRVVDPEGKGLSGVRVLMANEYNPAVPLEAVNVLGRQPFPTVEAVTDEDGIFRSAGKLEPRQGVSLVVLDRRYRPYRLEGAWLYPDRSLNVGELRLQPGEALRGQVVDSQGIGVAARLVQSLTPDENIGWDDVPQGWGEGVLDLGATDEHGRFELQGLSPGAWNIVAVAEGFLPGKAGGSSGKSVPKPVRIQLERGAAISGRLLDVPEDELGLRVSALPPHADAKDVMARAVPLGNDGHFRFNGLVADQTYRVSVFRVGQGQGHVAEVEPVEVEAQIVDPPTVQLRWHALQDFDLRFIDAIMQEPIEECEVHLSARSIGTQPLEAGYFPEGRLHLEGVEVTARSKAKLLIQSPGYLDHWLELDDLVETGSPGEIIIQLQPSPTIEVLVKDAQGDPIEAAEVLMGAGSRRQLDRRSEAANLEPRTWRTRRALTGGDGRATLSALSRRHGPRDKRRIAVFAQGYAPSWIDVDSQEESFEVTLAQGAALAVRVVDEAGTPLDGVVVELERVDDSTWPMKAASTEGGAVTFQHLMPGRFRYRARVHSGAWRPPGYNHDAAWVPVDLPDGATTEGQLESRGSCDLTGTIGDRHGPLAGAEMVLLPGDRTTGEPHWMESHVGRGTRFHVQSRVDGSFHFHAINEGEYTMLVQHSSLTIPARLSVVVSRDTEPLAIRLGGTAIEGSVTFAGGRPAANAFVSIKEVGGPARGTSETDERGRFVITGVPSGRPLEVRANGRFVYHEPESLPPLLPDEVRRVPLMGDERGAIRFTLIGPNGASFRVQGRSADGLHKATMVRPGESEAIKETSGCVPGLWVFQLEATRADGTKAKEERRMNVVPSRMVDVTFQAE